ncbi:Heparan-sulfate 6-O-sulfotransferase 1 [Camelus dromedarius]|uniref:Heparan-sulfate 6-O-sulfotransferase n=1 Tax=Camelus dromedarius TaxID=9838 RepID=A0A5N4E837_CAMDR|nr:Heparan-sulfate 6-O-sulfotransferase 1 [Camelus dromedarius]
MAFFGLTVPAQDAVYLFERTFNLKFIRPLDAVQQYAGGRVEVGEDPSAHEELNDRDMPLYDYARDLFQQRLPVQAEAGAAGQPDLGAGGAPAATGQGAPPRGDVRSRDACPPRTT